MENKEYAGQLDFWIEHFGKDFFDLLDEMNISLDDDVHHFLDISPQNKTIVKNLTLDELKNMIVSYGNELNFRRPSYSLNDMIKSSEIKQDSIKIELQLITLLKKNIELIECSSNQNKTTDKEIINKFIEVVKIIDKKITSLETSFNENKKANETKIEAHSNKNIKERIIDTYNRYSIFILLISILITALIVRW